MKGRWYLDKERNKIVLLDDNLNYLREFDNGNKKKEEGI